MTRLGVIGTGAIATVHMENLRKLEGVEIAALCDISETSLENSRQRFGGATYHDAQEMLSKENLDGVLLCTPPRVREEPIRACAEAGVPVFIEKPPAVDLDEALSIIHLLEESGLPHFVGFVFRWTKGIEETVSRIQGRPVYGLQSCYFANMMFPEGREKFSPAYYDKKQSGGMIGDQGIHMLDLHRYIAGSEVRSVFAVANNLYQPKTAEITTEETVSIQFDFENGTVSNHLHSWTFPRWQVHATAFGEGFDLHYRLHDSSVSGQIDGDGIEIKQEEQLHLPEMRAFVEFVRTGDPSLVKSDFRDAAKTLSLVHAVEKTLSTGAPVYLHNDG